MLACALCSQCEVFLLIIKYELYTKSYVSILGNRIDVLRGQVVCKKGYSTMRKLGFMSWVNIWIRRVAKKLLNREAKKNRGSSAQGTRKTIIGNIASLT